MTRIDIANNEIACAVINLSALRHNSRQVRKQVSKGLSNSKVMAVVKANAYGHGIVEVAKALSVDDDGEEYSSKVDGFGVARLEEALLLREHGIQQPILLLSGFIFAADLPLIAGQQIQIAVHSEWQIKALEQARLPAPVTVWLKVDSGMHRLGFAPDKVDAAFARLNQCANVQKPVYMMTHLAFARTPDCYYSLLQTAAFYGATRDKTASPRSTAASGAIFTNSFVHQEWVRPGIALYGVSPLDAEDLTTGLDIGLRPVMTLQSRLIAVREHRRGQTVGYYGRWRSTEDTRIGVVALGYGDGYPRRASGRTIALVNGEPVHFAGWVSMDMICLELGPNSTAQPGDPVVFWGEGLPVEKIADITACSPYELLAGLTPRVHYRYVEDA